MSKEKLKHALNYAAAGFHVLPVSFLSSETLTRNGAGDASTDKAQIHRWFSGQLWNVGIATGKISNIIALEIRGKLAEEKIRELESIHSQLPPTFEIKNRECRWVFFLYPKVQTLPAQKSLGAGLILHGDGSFVVAPPSYTSEQGDYSWSVDSKNTIAHAPSWFVELLDVAG